MICVSIAQVSQRLALVDMINASRQCDLIEIRLDRFEKAPDIKMLLQSCRKPAIISCRRPQDGGDWQGSEEARLALLRQAVLEKAAYVEIELDVADQVRRYGETKRIIAYTNTRSVPADLEDIYADACEQDPDVVKITVPTKTPVDAWPLIKIVAKGQKPTVAVGWGRSSIMLNVLGRRYKSPWIYAALEKGMEAYPGMATIAELEEVYDYRNITSRTPLLAISGFSEEQMTTARVLNHGFRLAENRTRCLPLEMGNTELFAKVARAIKLAGIIVDDQYREQILQVCTKKTESAQLADAADLVVINDEQWLGFNTLTRAVVDCMERAMNERYPGDRPLAGRPMLVVGCSGTARSIAAGLNKAGALVTIADRDNARSQRVARELGIRYIAASQVYTATTDGAVLLRSDTDPKAGKAAVDVPKGIAREGMLAVDLTSFPYMTPFLKEVACLRGMVVRPIDIFTSMMQAILKIYTGQLYTPDQLLQPLEGLSLDFLGEEEDE